MNYSTNAHSVYSLNYHLILVIKYRRKVINDNLSLRLKEIFEYIAVNYNIHLVEWNHDMDHIHVLFEGEPNSNISKFINAYKSASSRLAKKEFPYIKEHLWEGNFWSKSFFLVSTGGITTDLIKKYIETQGEHSHGKRL